MNFIRRRLFYLLPLNLRIYLRLQKIINGKYGEWFVNEDTDLCLTGYPRSGNTFLYLFFKIYYKNLILAHHIHLPEQFEYALKLKIPTIVIIRSPKESISSLLVLKKSNNKSTTIQKELLYYIDYHLRLKRFVNNRYLLVIKFEQLTSDLETTLNKINKKFNTDFLIKDTLEEINNNIFQEMEILNKEHFSGNKETNYKPSKYKDELKKIFARELEKDKNFKLLEKANAIYADIQVKLNLL